jgi:hypothetical protein
MLQYDNPNDYEHDTHNANDNDNSNEYANDNHNDNDNANDYAYANANGFIGHSFVSCFSLDSPRPWPGSTLLAPFCWAAARWDKFILGKNLRPRQKEFIARMFFKWALFNGSKSPSHARRKIKLVCEAGETLKVKKGGGWI